MTIMIRRFVERNFLARDLSDAETNLLHLVRLYMSASDIDFVNRALRLARDTSLGITGSRPLPPLEHALAVTTILAEMHIDAVGVAAGLVFEAVDADLLPMNRVERTLGMPTARIVGSMLRLNILERKKQSVSMGAAQNEREDTGSMAAVDNKKPRLREAMRRQQAETVRKMFVAMADDPRVVVLKLAYRLHALRLICRPGYLGDLNEALVMAEEAREIYAPLAGRLGMSRLESEVQDLAFQILEPERYIWVRDIIELESKQWRTYVEQVCVVLRKEMKTLGVKAEVSGRVKHLYSFYRKLVRTVGDVEDFEQIKAAADISQVHDLVAFRVLVDTTTDCYVVLGHVHSLWRPKEGRIKDYIANPKPNGYQALHTTVFCLDDHLVEIQIRTHEMHEMAEYGVAMHWHYKDIGDHASASAKELLTWLRQLSEWQRDIRTMNTSDAEFVEAVKGDIFDEQIFVFTPKGEVKELPVGSTPLDFAYRVHTDVGDKCAGARIISETGSGDGERLVTRMVPLNYELKNGEIVDIVTNRTAHPTRDWLSFAHTAAARSKIRRYLKLHERDINVQIGRERLERDLKALGPRGVESLTEEMEDWLCDEFHLDNFDDVLAAVGADDIRPHAIGVKLSEFWRLREGNIQARDDEDTLLLPAIGARQGTVKQSTEARLQVAGVEGLLTRLANCCCPLPSDEIVGFVSRGKGVIVHRVDCSNIKRLREKERERLISVTWGGMNQQRYLAPIIINARDRPGLLRDVSTVMLDAGVNLVSVNTHVNSQRETLIHATLELDDLEQMQHILNRVSRVKDVTHAERDMGSKKNGQK